MITHALQHCRVEQFKRSGRYQDESLNEALIFRQNCSSVSVYGKTEHISKHGASLKVHFLAFTVQQLCVIDFHN